MKKTNGKSKLKKFLLISSIILATFFVLTSATIALIYNSYKLDKEKLTILNNGIKVYSAIGEDTTIYNTNRSIISIETLPNYVKQAFIDTEDKRFYTHNGFDIKRIIKAGFVNLTAGSKSQGASTISQQLIKNALLTNEKTFARKIKEVILSIKMEKEFTKNEILEMYLNTIYFGSNAYGIENASLTYFNKSSKDLTLNEACCLAGLIKSPSYYSPKLNYENSVKRKNLVAKNMYKNKHITEEEFNNVISKGIILNSNVEIDHSYEKEAIYEACKLLNLTERDLINKNYQIITFKDDKLQNEVIQASKNTLNAQEDIHNINLDSLSIVVNKLGKVVAYYANSNYDLHDIKRQPASIFKPLAVYLPALSYNILTPASLILDEEINYSGFSPKNADKKYHGYVSAKNALSNSLNIPSVKILDCVGLKKSKEMLTDLGINITNSDMNLSLALGATKNGVKLTDITAAYSCIANLGLFREISFVDKILDKNGNIIYTHEDFNQQVVDSESCFLLTEMLKETVKTGTAKRMENLNIPIAAKTGTASNGNFNTDLYNVAYTTEHTMLTWISNIKDNKLPNEMLSSSQPTDINKQICKFLYPNSVKDFVIPQGVQKMGYDLIEYENNHRVISPTQESERYIAYDYFKITNPPPIIEANNETDLNIELSRLGIDLSFDSKKNKIYNVYRKYNNNKKLIQSIKDSSGNIQLKDTNIFSFDSLDYFIENEKGEVISEIKTVRPKDYLVNLLNNNITNGKHKWYV